MLPAPQPRDASVVFITLDTTRADHLSCYADETGSKVRRAAKTPHFDASAARGLGMAEQIVAKAIRNRRDKVVLATKCGLVWHTDQGTYLEVQYGKRIYRFLGPESIQHKLEASLRRLGTDYIRPRSPSPANARA